jgi:protein-tyrosine phosphatase
MSAGETSAVTTDGDDAPRTRLHAVPGVYNLRDTGGYRAAGGTTRWGKLFRSDALHRLDPTGRALLRRLGITRVVDLRSTDELASAPSSIDGVGATVHHLPVFDEAAPADQAMAPRDLAAVYTHMIDERGAQLAAAIRIIADAAEGEAVLVHCTAGKDRTGLVVALALRAAGVDKDEVVADYAATAENLGGEWADTVMRSLADQGVELTPAVVELITASPAQVMHDLLDRLDREYGSTPQYLRAQGLTSAELDRLTAALIV